MSDELVALLTLSRRNADHERAELCLRSLDVNLRDPLQVVILCPRADMAQLDERFAKRAWQRISVSVLDETPLLTREIVEDGSVRGTVRQMLLKLAFASVCRARYYLTLDADVALIRPLLVSALLPAGRALLQPKPSRDQRKWFDASAKLHGAAPRYEDSEGMDVTPAILMTRVVRSLIAHLTERHGDWRRALAKAHAEGELWTEYTLYYHHLAHLGLQDRAHVSNEVDRIMVPRCVWRKEHLERWTLERALKGRGWFVVIQSTTGLTPEEVSRLLAPAMQP